MIPTSNTGKALRQQALGQMGTQFFRPGYRDLGRNAFSKNLIFATFSFVLLYPVLPTFRPLKMGYATTGFKPLLSMNFCYLADRIFYRGYRHPRQNMRRQRSAHATFPLTLQTTPGQFGAGRSLPETAPLWFGQSVGAKSLPFSAAAPRQLLVVPAPAPKGPGR